MRLIDADALMEDLSKWIKEVDPTHPPEDNAMPPMEDIIVSTLMTIEEQPTIDAVPERKNGRWVELYDSNYKCSECGAWWHSDEMDINEEFRFCPSCGAKMEGAEDAGREH
jgi:DNA-directed RNA polymerase subunit RPC12/RpoP